MQRHLHDANITSKYPTCHNHKHHYGNSGFIRNQYDIQQTIFSKCKIIVCLYLFDLIKNSYCSFFFNTYKTIQPHNHKFEDKKCDYLICSDQPTCVTCFIVPVIPRDSSQEWVGLSKPALLKLH
jgi:hypothetical protein